MSEHSLQDLLQIMSRLRGPQGCAWDIEQTHESILSCLIEESYEFIDAVQAGDEKNMQEELGDLLLQVVFHAQMAQETGRFDFSDIVQTLCEKLIRRHPHVFGDIRISEAGAAQKQWDELKVQERKESGPGNDSGQTLAGIPKNLPALLKAAKMQKKAAKVGFDWPSYEGPLEKIMEELDELKREIQLGDKERMEEEFGDLLFSVVNLGRRLNMDPEKCLGRANTKFKRRFQDMERIADGEGKTLDKHTLEELESLWERVKARG